MHAKQLCTPSKSLTQTPTDVNTDVLLSVDPSKDKIVSAIEKRVAAWTFLPEGNLHWVICLMPSWS